MVREASRPYFELAAGLVFYLQGGRLMRLFKNFFCLCLIMVLPIGYYGDANDSSSVWFRLGGGTGQYSTIVESCTKPPVMHSDNFSDVGAAIVFRPSREDPFVFGLRGGHLSAGTIPEGKYGSTLEHGYVNPFASIEWEKFGIGAGLVRNLGPKLESDLFWDVFTKFYDYEPDMDFRKGRNYLSGHIRLGSYSSIYGIGSLNEGVPIASQYGYLLLGLGYGGVADWHFTSGISAGFYDHPGFYFGLGHDLKGYGRPEFSFRLGSAEDDFEGGFSFGWTIPLN